MRLFGFDIIRTKAGVAPMTVANTPGLANIPGNGGWFGLIRESFAGAWQRNVEFTTQDVLAFHAVYSCVTLIASDIAKLRVKLVEQDGDGIWSEVTSAAFSPVLRKPNRYQTRIKFFEQWLISKLVRGNTYVLKERDNRGIVVAMYILDATRVRPLVAPDGSVYYELAADDLAGVETGRTVVPASEIIHDIMCALYHPLCGVAPIYACGLAATQGLRIQNHSAAFFGNGARPSGILTAPGLIDQVTADRLKSDWDTKFGGVNSGKVAVLGDGLKYEQMVMTAVDAQMVETLKLTAEIVCSAYHVPPYMIGVGAPPSYNNIQALNQQYYSQCLQTLIESMELLLDEGLGLTEVKEKTYGTEVDLEALLRMDTATAMDVAIKAVGGAIYTPDEARKKFDLKPVKGGNTPYLQQQNYSLAALAERDADRPFAKPAPAAPSAALAGDAPPADPPPPKSVDVSKIFGRFDGRFQLKEAA